MNLTLNPNLSDMFVPSGIPTECYNDYSGTIEYNLNCMINHICPQLPEQLIFSGKLILGIMFVLMIFQLLINRTKLFDALFKDDINKKYWCSWIDTRIIVICFCYILLVTVIMGGLL